MGEVYRATDTHLRRQVAIKVLSASVSRDEDRLARFQREAEVLGALNHPNIAQIHGLEKSAGTMALVMELVDGPTLADRIADGPVALNESLAIARQIADALEAAHDRGIVHRDLKPANIMIRVDGTVKVLDFGLAKAMESAVSGLSSVSQSPTITSPAVMTGAGIILGTAAYMSPEQARGKPVDAQTDVWAFGCVVYELLTGRRAFPGETVTDVLAAVIEREPDWRLVPDSVPTGLRRLLRRCLTKDQKRRLHDIADARLDLDEDSGAPIEAQASLDARRPAGTRAWIVALGASAIAAAMATWIASARTRVGSSDGPAPDAKLERLTYDSGVTGTPALSPDGRLLAYGSDRAGNGDLDVWVQQMSGGTPLRLTDDPADDSEPDFSPDGSQVAFRSERNGGGVYVVPALGGPARLIAEGGRRPRFSPDGTHLAYWSGQFRGTGFGQAQTAGSSVYVVALAGGAPVRLLPDFVGASDPVWAPDGHSILIAGRRDQAGQLVETFDWWLAPIDGRPAVKTGVFEKPPLRGTFVPPSRWASTGVLFSSNDDLWRVMLSGMGRLAGVPERLTLGVGPYFDPAPSPDGSVVFADFKSQRVVERVSLEKATDPPVRLYEDAAPSTWRASATSDGSVIVFERAAGAWREIWSKDTRAGRQAMVVRVQTEDQLNATVSGDGARIAYTQDSHVTGGAAGTGYVIETSGGVPRKVCDACELHGFLADNERVLVALADGHAIRSIDVRTGATRDLAVAETGTRLDRPHASPDDRWLAFRRTRTGVGKTVVTRLDAAQPAQAERLDAVDEPTITGRPGGWSLDSRIVYLMLDTDGFRCVWGQRIDPETGVLAGKPFAVRHFHATNGMSTSFGNAVTASGFLYEAAESTANLWKLTVPRRR